MLGSYLEALDHIYRDLLSRLTTQCANRDVGIQLSKSRSSNLRSGFSNILNSKEELYSMFSDSDLLLLRDLPES